MTIDGLWYSTVGMEQNRPCYALQTLDRDNHGSNDDFDRELILRDGRPGRVDCLSPEPTRTTEEQRGSASTRPWTLSDNGDSIKLLDSTKDLGLTIANTFKP